MGHIIFDNLRELVCNSRNPDPRREEGRVGAAADDTVSADSAVSGDSAD